MSMLSVSVKCDLKKLETINKNENTYNQTYGEVASKAETFDLK